MKLILSHAEVVENRFIKVKSPEFFIDNEDGILLFDAIVIRLQAEIPPINWAIKEILATSEDSTT